jgi:hypothetical protein
MKDSVISFENEDFVIDIVYCNINCRLITFITSVAKLLPEFGIDAKYLN